MENIVAVLAVMAELLIIIIFVMVYKIIFHENKS
jgi:hypothetical protein